MAYYVAFVMLVCFSVIPFVTWKAILRCEGESPWVFLVICCVAFELVLFANLVIEAGRGLSISIATKAPQTAEAIQETSK